jgi:hypothetical protein
MNLAPVWHADRDATRHNANIKMILVFMAVIPQLWLKNVPKVPTSYSSLPQPFGTLPSVCLPANF